MENNTKENFNGEAYTSGKGAEDKNKLFSELIQNEYKDEFNKIFNKQFGKRFKKMKETEEDLELIKQQLSPLMSYYGTDDIKTLVALILKDLQKEVFTPGINEVKKDKAIPEMYEKWMVEALETSKIYPEFQFAKEIENPEFVKGLRAGIPMTSLYRAMHFDEISKGISETAAKAAVENIRAGKGRINELGIENLGSVRARKKAEALTDSEIEEILEKVKKGEKISFAQ